MLKSAMWVAAGVGIALLVDSMTGYSKILRGIIPGS